VGSIIGGSIDSATKPENRRLKGGSAGISTGIESETTWAQNLGATFGIGAAGLYLGGKAIRHVATPKSNISSFLALLLAEDIHSIQGTAQIEKIDESLQYLSNVDIYLKSNLLKCYAGRQDSGVFFSRLPYWINCDVYPSDIAIKDKEYDVCFAGALNSNARQFAVDTLKRLADYDLNIYIPSENLDKKSYCQMLQKSWLALSPEGIGFHCFRHYEAMAMGAVPLINFPETDLITCHEDTVDVLFFNLKFEDFKEKIMNSLRDKEMLMKIILNNLANLEAKHSPRAVGKEILDLCDQLEQGLI
jgi:hypothetical protein